MAIAYFKKSAPAVKVILSTGESLQFEAVSYEEGVYPRAEDQGISERLINELRNCIARGVGGITEISRDEFLELLKKKQTDPDGLQRPWREEFKPRLSLEQRTQSVSTPTTAPQGPVVRVGTDMHGGVSVAPDKIERAPTVPQPDSVPTPNVPGVPSLPKPTASKPKKAR